MLLNTVWDKRVAVIGVYKQIRSPKILHIFQQVNVSPESLRFLWYPELEIYGLERFGRQRVLKEMSGIRIRKNKTIHYELGYVFLQKLLRIH